MLAGRGATIAYFGAGTGTSPLPITLAHLNRSVDVNDPAAYTGGVWTSTTFTGPLDPYFPNPGSFASNLYLSSFSPVDTAHNGATTRLFDNAMALGYPSNFWVMNPLLNTVEVGTNSTNHPMNHLVILQVRRRLAAGLAAQLSYTWQRNISGQFQDFHLPLLDLQSNGVPHAIQTLWTYDIPVGRGKKYGANMNSA